MRIRVGLAAIIGCAVLCLALPAFGQVSITLTGVNGSTSGSALNGEDVYTGLYYATVNGIADQEVICDDFTHNVTIGETWNAVAINTSALNSTNIRQTEFGGAIGLQGYAEVATLISEIYALNNSTGAFGGQPVVSGTDLSEAIWDITTPVPPGLTGSSPTALALVTYVKGLYKTDDSALAYLSTLNLWIMTPSPNSGPQEFWKDPPPPLPEGGAAPLYLFFAGLACFGAMCFSPRNQFGNRVA